MILKQMLSVCSTKTQHARGWNTEDICTNSVYTIPQRWGPDYFLWASRPLLPAAWLALLLTKAWDVESNPGLDLDLTFVTNKQQTSIRCINKHWVHLKSTQIKQRQFKADWRCTIHPPTQIVTTTPTHNIQPKDKNIVILQININGIRNKISATKKPRTQHLTRYHHRTRKLKHQNYTTIRTDREHKQGG